jgi:hypothetical protein
MKRFSQLLTLLLIFAMLATALAIPVSAEKTTVKSDGFTPHPPHNNTFPPYTENP